DALVGLAITRTVAQDVPGRRRIERETVVRDGEGEAEAARIRDRARGVAEVGEASPARRDSDRRREDDAPDRPIRVVERRRQAGEELAVHADDGLVDRR